MNGCCNHKINLACNECDPCGNNCGGGCCPAKFDCSFDVYADAYDPRYWFFEINGCSKRIRLPDLAEKGTFIDIDCSSKTMTYYGETETQTFTGEQLGCLFNLDDLRDVNAPDAEPCSMLVFNPGCGRCPCTPEEATWQPYQIPDAGDCVIEPDDDGYYKVLIKNECGCVEECRLPVVAPEAVVINYERDSVPDDPDFPWYYGAYNDHINLHLEQNAEKYFGIYALEVTINYGIQVVKSTISPNVNFRSLVVPVVDGETTNVEKEASILQSFALYSESPEIPWGSTSLRGSFTFIVPKGKEAYLHHEFRLRTVASGMTYSYAENPTYDGKIVPANEATGYDKMKYIASRLNALQVIVKPVNGISNMNPVVDPYRDQLDPAVDEYPTN